MPHLCLGWGAWAHVQPWAACASVQATGRRTHRVCTGRSASASPHAPTLDVQGCAAAEVENKINPVPAFALLRSFSLSPFPFASFSIFN